MQGPLDGIRVFGMGHAGVGPFAEMELGGLGAEVFKIEAPGGELNHRLPPTQNGMGVVYITNNHNKRPLTLDLKDKAHLEAAYKLVATCDVLIENMSPGTVDRLGLSYEVVSRLNPRIVYVSATAYGTTGPMGRAAGADPTVQSFSGFTSVNGGEGGRGEFLRFFGHLDHTVSTYIVAAVLKGLVAREKTGRGQHVTMTMVGCAVCIMTTTWAQYLASGVLPQPMGSADPKTCPHEAFLCQDKKYLAVGVVNEAQWAGFCRAIRRENLLADPQFATNALRVEHRDELLPILREVFASKPLRWWELQLSRELVPQGRFLLFSDLKDHPQITENGMMPVVNTPHWGPIYTGGIPWQFSKTPLGAIQPALAPGELTEEVLREVGASLPEPATTEASGVVVGRRSRAF